MGTPGRSGTLQRLAREWPFSERRGNQGRAGWVGSRRGRLWEGRR